MVLPKVSIVIVNYNVKELLIHCIESIYKYNLTNVPIEIIVVDNNSSDDSCKVLKDRFQDVLLIENKYNAGFPKANNQGFSIAKGDFIFMLNPDTEFLEDSLNIILEYFKDNSSVSIVAPMLLNSDGSRQLSVWRNPSLKYVFYETNYLNFLLKRKNYLDFDYSLPFQAETFSGAAIFFKKEVLTQIGDLDEKMFWIEDVDFCYRASNAELECVYLPTTKIKHHVGQSAKKNYNISLSNQIFNKIKFFKKHYSIINYILVLLLSFYHVIFKIILFGFLSPFNVIYFRKFKAYLYTFPKLFNVPDGIS